MNETPVKNERSTTSTSQLPEEDINKQQDVQWQVKKKTLERPKQNKLNRHESLKKKLDKDQPQHKSMQVDMSSNNIVINNNYVDHVTR